MEGRPRAARACPWCPSDAALLLAGLVIGLTAAVWLKSPGSRVAEAVRSASPSHTKAVTAAGKHAHRPHPEARTPTAPHGHGRASVGGSAASHTRQSVTTALPTGAGSSGDTNRVHNVAAAAAPSDDAHAATAKSNPDAVTSRLASPDDATTAAATRCGKHANERFDHTPYDTDPCCTPEGSRCGWSHAFHRDKLKPDCERKNLVGILKWFQQVVTVDWFVGDGTLLGAVRRGGFIPTTNDTGIALFMDAAHATIARKEIEEALNCTHFGFSHATRPWRLAFSATNEVRALTPAAVVALARLRACTATAGTTLASPRWLRPKQTRHVCRAACLNGLACHAVYHAIVACPPPTGGVESFPQPLKPQCKMHVHACACARVVCATGCTCMHERQVRGVFALPNHDQASVCCCGMLLPRSCGRSVGRSISTSGCTDVTRHMCGKTKARCPCASCLMTCCSR